MPGSRRALRCVSLVVLVAMTATGCGAQMHERLRSAPPLTVGLVIGHDVNAITSLTTGEEVLVAFSFGLIGLGLAAATAEKQVLPFEAELREVVVGKLVSQLAAKRYRAQLVFQKPKTWALLENLGPDAYGGLLKAHGLEEPEAQKFDAVLFVEYWVEGRLEGRFLSSPKTEDLELNRMRPKYAKSKLFLYDTRTGTRLYFDQTQRGYPAFTDATLAHSARDDHEPRGSSGAAAFADRAHRKHKERSGKPGVTRGAATVARPMKRAPAPSAAPGASARSSLSSGLQSRRLHRVPGRPASPREMTYFSHSGRKVLLLNRNVAVTAQ